MSGMLGGVGGVSHCLKMASSRPEAVVSAWGLGALVVAVERYVDSGKGATRRGWWDEGVM